MFTTFNKTQERTYDQLGKDGEMLTKCKQHYRLKMFDAYFKNQRLFNWMEGTCHSTMTVITFCGEIPHKYRYNT